MMIRYNIIIDPFFIRRIREDLCMFKYISSYNHRIRLQYVFIEIFLFLFLLSRVKICPRGCQSYGLCILSKSPSRNMFYCQISAKHIPAISTFHEFPFTSKNNQERSNSLENIREEPIILGTY